MYGRALRARPRPVRATSGGGVPTAHPVAGDLAKHSHNPAQGHFAALSHFAHGGADGDRGKAPGGMVGLCPPNGGLSADIGLRREGSDKSASWSMPLVY